MKRRKKHSPAEQRAHRKRDQYKAARECARKRGRGQCEWCGTKKPAWPGFQVHHMRPRSRNSVLYCRLENLVFVCARCHLLFEKAGQAPILTEIFKKQRPSDWRYIKARWHDMAIGLSAQLELLDSNDRHIRHWQRKLFGGQP